VTFVSAVLDQSSLATRALVRLGNVALLGFRRLTEPAGNKTEDVHSFEMLDALGVSCGMT